MATTRMKAANITRIGLNLTQYLITVHQQGVTINKEIWIGIGISLTAGTIRLLNQTLVYS